MLWRIITKDVGQPFCEKCGAAAKPAVIANNSNSTTGHGHVTLQPAIMETEIDPPPRPPKQSIGGATVDATDTDTAGASPPPPASYTGNPDWLHGKLTKTAVAELLDSAGGKDGTFLVCEHTEQTTFVLHVVYKGKPTTHGVIWDYDSGLWSINKSNFGKHDDLRGLVLFLKEPPMVKGRAVWPAPLLFPVSKDAAGGVKPSSKVRYSFRGKKKPIAGATTDDSGTDGAPTSTKFGAGKEGATLYQHGGFKGWAATFGPGMYGEGAFTKAGAKNDDASSLVVDPGFEAAIFQFSNFTGGHVHFPEGKYDLHDFQKKGASNDQASSIIVRRADPASSWGAGPRPAWLHGKRCSFCPAWFWCIGIHFVRVAESTAWRAIQ
jgi:hypothetical protein